MTNRQVLVDASDDLDHASHAARGTLKERLDEETTHMAERAQAEDVDREDLAERDEALAELAEGAGDDVAEYIESAREKIRSVLESE